MLHQADAEKPAPYVAAMQWFSMPFQRVANATPTADHEDLKSSWGVTPVSVRLPQGQPWAAATRRATGERACARAFARECPTVEARPSRCQRRLASQRTYRRTVSQACPAGDRRNRDARLHRTHVPNTTIAAAEPRSAKEDGSGTSVMSWNICGPSDG